MSLHLEFEPHSWYMGFAIKENHKPNTYWWNPETKDTELLPRWAGYTANGMTGYIDELEANTLKELKQLIKEYRSL